MGTLRFTFTLTILLGHIYSIFGFRYHELLSSPIAFESFFLLSGFYMAMVWHYDYNKAPNGFKKFLTKRVLRIFPLYWLVLLVTICISLITYATINNPLLLKSIFEEWNHLKWQVKLYVLFSNLFIFGQEAFYFVKINFNTGTFEWSHKFIDGNPPLHFFLLISQAWAISYILYFYLLLPVLSRFTSLILFGVMVLSLAARFTWYGMGHQEEPWLYRFFPFEFAFFLSGMLSFRIYNRWKETIKLWRGAILLLFLIFFLTTCLYDLWPIDYLKKQWLYYGMLTVFMPLFFSLTKNNKADNYLGELAYPMYIANFILIHLIKLCGFSNPLVLLLLIIGATLALSILLVQFILEPLNRFAFAWLGILEKKP
jgi:peptidoglycan/LPS O-acetylase OafA/YrhL